ncbi:hypothetical protein LR69_01549 [Geobacillus sp. BCO2]|nr:hypothetical protein LR69_01549 [Geobacillus sp. BCO2]
MDLSKRSAENVAYMIEQLKQKVESAELGCHQAVPFFRGMVR